MVSCNVIASRLLLVEIAKHGVSVGTNCTDNAKSLKHKHNGGACVVAECAEKNVDMINVHTLPIDPTLRRQHVNYK